MCFLEAVPCHEDEAGMCNLLAIPGYAPEDDEECLDYASVVTAGNCTWLI
jgi:hypothetical protein